MKNYELELVPECGRSLASETRAEYNLGYYFRVVFSTLRSLDRGSRVTKSEVDGLCEQYGIKINVKFDTLTLSEMDELADSPWLG